MCATASWSPRVLRAGSSTGSRRSSRRPVRRPSGSRYRASIDPADVVEFLLLSPTFPRSVLFCLRSVERDLERLELARTVLSRPQRLLGRTRADLEYLDVHELLDQDLHVFLDRLLDSIRQVAESVGLQYFRSSEEASMHSIDPYETHRNRTSCRSDALPRSMRYDIRYRTSVIYDDARPRVVQRATRLPLHRRPPAPHRLQRQHASSDAGRRLHGLLGHPGRRLRRPRTARGAGDRGRGNRRDPSAAAA